MKYSKFAIVAFATLLSGAVYAQDYPGPNPEPQVAEIQIFYGYRGYNNYDFKRVSSSHAPLSLGLMVNGWRVAACYKGNPETALDLLSQMVDIYNYQTGRNIQVYGATYFFYGDGKGALRFETVDEWNRDFLSYPRIIECDRWSTPAERGGY